MKLSQLYYNNRYNKLLKFGEKHGLITDFPEEMWKKLENCYYCGTPMSVLLSNNFNLHKCHDRAYGLTMAFDKCTLVHGSLIKFGKIYTIEYDPDFEHSWVEDDKYVYDTTFIKRYNKKFYYFLYGAKPEKKVSSEELNKDDYYIKMKTTTKEDIENGYDISTTNAWLAMEVLKLKEKNTGKDLSKYKNSLPQVDLEIVNERIDTKLDEIYKNEKDR